MPNWCAVNIRFTCANMYDKIETISVWEDAKVLFTNNNNEHEIAYVFDNWHLVDATLIKTINSTTFEVSGIDSIYHASQFFQQLLPLFACTFIEVKYAEQMIGFYGCRKYFIDDNKYEKGGRHTHLILT